MSYLKRSNHLLVVLLLLCSMTAVATANEIEIGDDHYLIFYHNDALGSPLAVTNHNGNVLWYEHSEPYGKTMTRVSQTGQEILNDRVGTRKGYTGHLNDTAADLVYMKARYYDPQIGRFYSNDPVGFVTHLYSLQGTQGFNRYAYVNSNPYKFIDPDGRYLVFAGEAEAVSMAKEQLARVAENSETGARAIKQLEDSPNVHIIRAGDFDSNSITPASKEDAYMTEDGNNSPGTGSIIEYNPNNLEGPKDDSGNKLRDPAIALGHEIGHAAQFDNGSHPRGSELVKNKHGLAISPQTPNHETGLSMQIDNEMRAEDSEADIRTHYYNGE